MISAFQRTSRLTFKQLTPPAVEPVLIADVKANCRFELGSIDDTIFNALIVAARNYVEDRIHKQLITATWRYSLDHFPMGLDWRGAFSRPTREGCDIILPRPPLISVSSIAYTDQNGSPATIDLASMCNISTDDIPGRITLAYNQIWPFVLPDTINCVQITYQAGYGADGSSVPQAIKQAMYQLIAFWYENRESFQVGGTSKEVDFCVDSLLSPHKCEEIW